MDHVPGTDISLTVPYAAEGPGPSFNTLGTVEDQEVVEISGAKSYPTTGQLNMTTVAVRTRMTLAQAIQRWLLSDDTLVPIEQIIPPELSPEQVDQVNKMSFSVSEAQAIAAALTYLDRPVVVEATGVLDNSAAQGKFSAGDRILAIDGRPVNQPTAVREAVLEHRPGDTVTVRVSRDKSERDVEVKLGESPQDSSQPMLGVLMTVAAEDGMEVDFNLQDIGGPSAGMIFALAVIDKFTPEELTGGHFVAGTGSISEDGSVGEIGGIPHKARSAHDLGAELFLAPAGNCAELGGQDYPGMTVARVSTLADAVTEMDNFAHGRPVNTCQ